MFGQKTSPTMATTKTPRQLLDEEVAERVVVLDRLATWLRAECPRDVLVPVDKKTPLRRHAGGAWGWEQYCAFRAEHPTHTCYGIVTADLCAVVLDDADASDVMEGGDELLRAPMAHTATGECYLFRRRQTAGALPSSLYSEGLVVVAPSVGMTWARAPWDTPVAEVSEPLLRLLRSVGPK